VQQLRRSFQVKATVQFRRSKVSKKMILHRNESCQKSGTNDLIQLEIHSKIKSYQWKNGPGPGITIPEGASNRNHPKYRRSRGRL
jgi:hypothetical protein